MHIRTFRAANLNAALATIREQMGPDASVLHTRQITGPMGRLLGRAHVEVTAGLRPSPARDSGTNDCDTRRAPPARAQDWAGAEQSLLEELNSSGLPHAVAVSWVDQCRRVTGVPLPAGGDAEEPMRHRLSAWLAESIPIAAPIRLVDRTRRIAALVGATGVGKTTTVAKLAARFRIDQKARVGLLTVDLFRAAAVEQIDAFARAMRVPLEVVRREDEVPEALRRLGDLDLVLVDTVGQSPRGAEGIESLRRLLAAIGPDETFLVIDANNSITAVRDCIAAFGILAPTALILSKTDEVRQAAPALAPILRGASGISYVTTGQNVPTDIASADGRRLAAWASGLAAIGV